MLTWRYEETIPTTANAEQIWALWSRPHEWNRWNEGLEWVILDGPFESGSRGRLKPAWSPVVKFMPACWTRSSKNAEETLEKCSQLAESGG